MSPVVGSEAAGAGSPSAVRHCWCRAHLRNGTTYAQLAAGFEVGTSTVYRYINEAVELLAALAPSLAEAAPTASAKAFVLLDGTLRPTDRIAADWPFYSGKHKKHGMNVQVLADPFGRLLWASPALPATEVPAARSAPRTGDGGQPSPQASRR